MRIREPEQDLLKILRDYKRSQICSKSNRCSLLYPVAQATWHKPTTLAKFYLRLQFTLFGAYYRTGGIHAIHRDAGLLVAS